MRVILDDKVRNRKKILDEFAEFKDKIIIGGGVNPEDISKLENEGVNKALIGTALHNGKISILQ